MQEIITTHVVIKDRAERDRLIEQYVAEYGEEVAKCVTGFIYCHVVEGVETRLAESRFHYLLNRIGELISLVAEHDETVDEREAIRFFASIDYEYSEDPEERLTDEAKSAEAAMLAVQTCLIANYFVRSGSAPWGIQSSLDLAEMCVLVEHMGIVLFDVVETFEEDQQVLLIHALLEDVERILRGLAHAEEIPVSDLVSRYFTWLVERDLG